MADQTVASVRIGPARKAAEQTAEVDLRARLDRRLSLRAADGPPDDRPDRLAVPRRDQTERHLAELSDRRDELGRIPQLREAADQLGLSSGDRQHLHLHVLVAAHQVRHRHDDRADPQQPSALPQHPVRHHAVAVDRAGDRDRADVEEHLRSAVRKSEPDPAWRRRHRPAAGVALRSEPRHAVDHRGERLEGNTLLRSPVSRRAEGGRSRAARGGRDRRRQRRAAFPPRDAAVDAIRHRGDAAPVVHLDLQPVRACRSS